MSSAPLLRTQCPATEGCVYFVQGWTTQRVLGNELTREGLNLKSFIPKFEVKPEVEATNNMGGAVTTYIAKYQLK